MGIADPQHFYTTEKALSENQVTLKAHCIIPKEDNEPIQLNWYLNSYLLDYKENSSQDALNH